MAEFTPSSQSDSDALPANSADSGGSGGKLLANLETLKNFERDLKSSTSHFQKWRSAAKKYYKTYAGDPWSAADREHLESTERPPVTLNFSLSTINALIGEDIGQRREVRFEGVDTDAYDSAVADWLTRTHRYLFAKCDGHRSDSHVYYDGLITGLGFSRTYLDNTRWPFRFRVGHINPWQVYADPDAKDDNLTDARFMIYQSKWTKSEAAARFGAETARTLSASAPGGNASTPQSVHANSYQESSPDTGDTDIAPKLTIYEYCYTRFEPWVAFTDPTKGAPGPDGVPTGEDVTMPEGEFKAAADAGVFGQEVLAVQYPKRVYRRAWIAGKRGAGDRNRILEDRPLDVDRFPISCYTGFRKTDPEKGRIEFFGLMHVIYEPQLMSSKVLTTILEIMARGAKGGVFFETGAVEDPEEFKSSFAVPGSAIQLADGGMGKIQERDAVKMPSGFAQAMEIARDGMSDASAVTRYLTGTAQAERSNVLISNLQTQSMTVLAPAVDPLSGFRMQQGLTLTQQAIKHLSVETINKIIGPVMIPGITHQEDPMAPGEAMAGPDGQPVLMKTPGEILKAADVFDFQVQVDTGAASPTARQAFWQLLVQHGLLQQLIEMGVQPGDILPDLMKLSPLPPEMSKPLAAKLKAALAAPKPEQIAAQLAKMSPEQQQMTLQLVAKAQEKMMPAAPPN